MPSERYRLETVAAFRHDLKALKRKHYDMSLLREPVDALMRGDWNLLAVKYSDHALKGSWQGFREFHVQGDWLVTYFKDEDSITLVLTRTGSHDELFGATMTRGATRAFRRAPRKPFGKA